MPTARILHLGSVLAVAACLIQPVPATADIVPAGRGTVWNPGIPGGIPNYTTVCATINAATYGNGAQDATSGIQNAINSCPNGQVVQLSAGDFLINSNSLIIGDPIVLRGAGPTLTKLRKTSTSPNPLIILGERFPNTGPSTNLVADAPKGATSVQVASASGFTVGRLVLVDEVTDPALTDWGSNCDSPTDACRGWFARFDRPIGQMLEVAAVNGNTVSFTTPLHIGFRTSRNAQLMRWANPYGVKNAGVEDLYVRGGREDNIDLRLAAYSWIKNVESDWSIGDSIALDMAFRCVVRDSYIHDTPDPNPGGAGYLLSFSWHSADNLIENNILINGNKVMVMRASGGGNVIGYNYFDNGYIGYQTDWQETGINAAHMTTPHFELFEGNRAFNIDADNSWGGSIYITFYRNHATGKRLSYPDNGNPRAAGLMRGHWWYTFAGNVLGLPTQSANAVFEDLTSPWTGNLVMWKIGYNPENWNQAADPLVVSSVVRDGNWDYATDTVRWQNPPQALPDSLYLPAKPAFFGTAAWPWVDPLGPTKVHCLPAHARYNATTCAPVVNPTVSVSDAAVAEGTGANTSAVFTVSLSAAASQPATVTYSTSNVTATAGSDYVAASGTVTFAVGSSSRTVPVTVVADAVDEVDETFRLDLGTAVNATVGDGQGVATIDDDDGPLISAAPVDVTEGNTGSTPASFNLSLSAASPQVVSVSYATSDGTAVAGSDYTSASGTVTFPAGVTSSPVVVNVTGDTLDEPNETFYVNLSAAVDASIASEAIAGRILDDDGGVITVGGLGHGSAMKQDLESAGGLQDRDIYMVSQPPRTSWEVIVDQASGDLGNGQGPAVDRVASDLTTVLQASGPVGSGPARRLRWRNTSATSADGYVRVMSSECTTNCGADDQYRVRAYETTGRISRFNTTAGQSCVLFLQNATSATVSGDVYFWSQTGALLATQAFTINTRSTQTINVASVPNMTNRSGTITVSHIAPHGGLVGKSVVLDPATGFSFDTPMETRGR